MLRNVVLDAANAFVLGASKSISMNSLEAPSGLLSEQDFASLQLHSMGSRVCSWSVIPEQSVTPRKGRQSSHSGSRVRAAFQHVDALSTHCALTVP